MYKVDIEQGSHEWFLLRQGCVTGTTLKSALGSPKVQETLMYKLLAERMTEPQISEIKAPAVVRGKEIESVARARAEKELGIKFAETGVLKSKDFDNFVISPDGIVEEKGKIIGGLEIKCPDSKKHLEYLDKCCVPDDYYYQVMAPFLMSDDVHYWWFFSFDDRNYELPCFAYKALREDFPNIEADREKLREFIAGLHAKHQEMTF